MTKRSSVLLGVVLTSGLLIGGLVVALEVPATRRLIVAVAKKTGLYRVAPPPPVKARALSEVTIEPDRVSVRLLVVDELYQAFEEENYPEAARLNALLSQEAAQRARRTLDAWKTLRDPKTLLVPRSNKPRDQIWRPEDTAADLFPFLLDAAFRLDRDEARIWMDTLASERRICGVTPCEVDLRSGQIVERSEAMTRFGTAEYSKDGLLALAERYGRGPWFDRMVEQIDALIEKADIATPAGDLISNDSEVNGELLMVLTRLYWATGKDAYLSMAERTAEAYLFYVFPNNHGLGAHFWDFETQSATPPEFRLRDHGSELIFGLGELFLLETLQERPQAERYREPLESFFDSVLALQRTDDGLFFDTYDPRTGDAPKDTRVIDTWGYVLTGFHAFDLAQGTGKYVGEIERTMRGVASRRSFRWEGDRQDGFADSIESMLYLLPFYDLPECRRWVDEEIEVMLAKQDPSGFVETRYLDGNFIRTALMYVDWKTQGVWLDSWTDRVRVGAARNPETGELFVSVATTEPWSGKLVFDPSRHETFWNLPVEYPRVNGRPAWYTIDEDASYIVTNLDSEEASTHSGSELVAGLAIELQNRALRLTVMESGSNNPN